MMTRMLVGLCAVLVLLGPAFAQTPPAPAGNAGSDESLWVSGEYLFAWFRGAGLPPLVTASRGGTPRELAGLLDNPATIVLFGDTGQYGDLRSGFRLAAGYPFMPDLSLGAEVGFRYVASQSVGFQDSSTNTPILARPFTNALTGLPQATLLAFPGLSTGAVQVAGHSGDFHDGWLDANRVFYADEGFRLDGLIGYRYFRHDERLQVRQVIVPTAADIVPGTVITAADHFATKNEFHGLDLGLRLRLYDDAFSFTVLGKVAVGNVRREVVISGNQIVATPGAETVVQPGGLLALSSNIGASVHNVWTLVPELGGTVGWQVLPNLRLTVGYTFLLLTSIARADDQIDTTINPNLFPPAVQGQTGPARPRFTFREADVWLQTVNLGAEFVY